MNHVWFNIYVGVCVCLFNFITYICLNNICLTKYNFYRFILLFKLTNTIVSSIKKKHYFIVFVLLF